MALLSFLGNEIAHEEGENVDPDPLLTIIATRRQRIVESSSFVSSGRGKSFVTVIVVYGNESFVQNNERSYELVVKGLQQGEWKYVVYKIDNAHTNPYRVWMEMGKPVFPGKKERQKIRDVEVGLYLF